MTVTYQELLPVVVSRISSVDEKLGARIARLVNEADSVYRSRAEEFFRRYNLFMRNEGRDLEFGIDCFVRLQRNVEEQRAKFIRSGRYPNTSFADVNREVYSNHEIMEYHMHGLVFAQFLWPDQYRRFQFFADNFPSYCGTIKRYLEIGGGHALYVSEADRLLPSNACIDLVDISPTSINMAKGIAGEKRIKFHLIDIYDFADEPIYDFITIGEVIEHLEQPEDLLSKIKRLLAPGGRVYLTTPANAPMVDHIYLFEDADQIRALLQKCGFKIESEAYQYAVDLPVAHAQRMKIPLMYASFLSA